ncbi:PhzF family phenazine biosynthesis protein [Brevibacillus brevis]|uniref:PhzF family phenazine biosynthesis protein n=1 Tax=Brevibacillus brevis TaxID=1393 RepID=A0ABY9T967_BREBE|nr:PhzF family phenazine biosynthesis protein [Brevibacillus brevis]WNC16658.1 PhzF family phenazine biosynthesis protein [Brevibacillus brevis]
MKLVSVYHVDAFTNAPFAGNPAGVVPDAGTLTVPQMQRIANELNLPESAFLMESDRPDADFRIRYFTPATEIDFCGHATVGSTWLLATERGWLEKGRPIVFETNVGLIPVELDSVDGQLRNVTMTQIAPSVREIGVDPEEVARLVGIRAEDMDDRYPMKLASTGGVHLLVPVRTRDAIDRAVPLSSELAALNRKHGITTTHLFTWDAPAGYDLYTRDFAPAIGIPEDPVTGAANGALSGYLALEGMLAKGEVHQLVIGQGHAIGRPGTLHVTVETTGAHPVIRVGGAAHITIAGQLRLGAE